MSAQFPLPIISGGRKRAARLLDAMQRCGIAPHLLSFDEPPVESQTEATARGWSFDFAPRPAPTRSLSGMVHGQVAPNSSQLVDRLRALAPGAAFVQLEEFGALQYHRVIPPGTPVIASPHNIDSTARTQSSTAQRSLWATLRATVRRRQLANLERACVRASHATLAVSAADVDHFRAVGGRNVLLVPNGVDAELFDLPLPAGGLHVLFFGQLAYRPNHEAMERFLIHSWPSVTDRHPAAELRMTGHGAPQRLIDLARATPGVRFLGFVDSLLEEIAGSQLVIAPIWAGGGTRIKVLEALAGGRAVVGTSLGVEQIGFEDGIHGRIADSDGDLAEAVADLLDDPGLARRLGNNARELGRRYDWVAATEPATELYRALIGER